MSVVVSVLVPVLDEQAHLEQCVPAMLGQRLGDDVEFLFLDGGSSDGSREVLERIATADPRVRVLDNPLRTTPAALNLGLREARGEFVARMDAHAHYPDDYLERGLRRLREGDAVSVSGPAIAVGDTGWSRVIALALGTALGVGGARFRRPMTREQEVPSGFTGLWRRDVLEQAGGWDPAAVGDEDTELAARLRKSGGRILCLPEMAAAYRPRSSLRQLAGQYWRFGSARVRTWREHPETLRPSQLLPASLVVTMAGAVLPVPLVRRASRAGMAVYAAALLTATAQTARRAPVREALGVPVVLPVMHVAYGLSFLGSWTRRRRPAAGGPGGIP